MKFKKFDLDLALEGKPLITKGGKICYFLRELSDLKYLQNPLWFGKKHIAAHVEGVGLCYYAKGADDVFGSITSDMDIVGMYVEEPKFDRWDLIDEKWNYLAADDDGSSYFFEEYPKKSEYSKGTWVASIGSYIGNPMLDEFFTYDSWENSVVKRNNKADSNE